MERLNLIIGLPIAAVSAIALLFPKLRESNFLKWFFLVFLVIGCLVSFFNLNWYLHWKYYDDEKIKIFLKQLPHVIKTDANQIYSYVLILENNYPPPIKITNVNVDLNSRMPLIDYNILLSDCDKDSIHIDLKDKSNLIMSTKELNGGSIFCLSFRCSPMLESMPKNMTLALRHIPVNFSYEIFKVPHKIPPDLGIKGVKLSNKQYYQKAIFFEKTIALDHRKVFAKEIEFQYGQYSFDNNLRSISIYCSSDKFINIKYDGLYGILKYKSKCKICPDCKKVDVIRMMVFKDDYFLLEATFGFEKMND